MRLAASLLAIALSAAACNSETDEFAEARRLAAFNLRDPESAQFRGLARCSGDSTIIRGEMNGRNAWGAYAGYSFFMVADGRAYFEDGSDGSAVEEFVAVAARCTGMPPDDFVRGRAQPAVDRSRGIQQ